MENPKTWGPVKRLIDQAIKRHKKDVDDRIIIAASDVHYIYTALEEVGYLTPEAVQLEAEHCTKYHRGKRGNS